MDALFEDAGKFHTGRVMAEADSSVQIELDSGKRVKVKAANVLLKFAQPSGAELLAQARALAAEIDLDLAWEFAPDDEFSFADLARDYYNPQAGPAQQTAALLRLFEAPHYFRRLGRGLFRKASEETVKAALQGIERKRLQAEQIATWADDLVAGRCPPSVREQLYRILFKPDKNSPEYKAVVAASRAAQRAPLDLLTSAGAIDSPYQFHWKRFLFEQFPGGTGFPPLPFAPLKEALPLAELEAFSIDDSSTTEIDDALSVQGLGTGTVVFGVHIAAPSLVIAPDSALDKVARDRLSTVYMPGHKVTMLPDDVVAACTLEAGRACPALSLYVTLDEATLAIGATETRVERVTIASNLRHDKLDGVVTEATLTGAIPATYPHAEALAFGWRLARHLKAQRELVRGKPENFNRPDYAFRLTLADGEDGAAGPQGDEPVDIVPRQRGAPLDLIVAEAMILANSTWGGWLAECGLPGIYRSQASMAPGVKVRMGIRAAPHAGMGVPQYAWCTSPLRRYVDLVNQWQLIACARHGRSAALAAPFKPKDSGLFGIVSGFEAAHAAYQAFQNDIERYWTLAYVRQHRLETLDAAVMKDGLVRAEALPLVFRALGAESMSRGARVRVRIARTDLLTLDLQGSVQSQLDPDGATASLQAQADDADDAPAGSGGLALAIDVDEPAAVAAVDAAVDGGG